MTSDAAPYHDRPAIVVHGLDHAAAALAAARARGRRIALLSAPGAARSAGAGWWRELVAQAGGAGDEAAWILDCADEAGMALAALREGVAAIALDADDATRARVAGIAARCGAALVRIDRSGALDLALSSDPRRDCEEFLGESRRGVANPGVLG